MNAKVIEAVRGAPAPRRRVSIVDMMEWNDSDLLRTAEYLRSLGYIVIDPRSVQSAHYVTNACPLCKQELKP